MLALTSLSPNHKNAEIQAQCVKSWIDAGFKPVSLNHPDEIDQLKASFKNVQFVPTRSTMEQTFGKPYVRVSALIDYAKDADDDHFLLINSDVMIRDIHGFTEGFKTVSETHLIYMHRYDYESVPEKGVRYDLGMDGFFIHKKNLHVFPQTLLCLGITHWDYWLPYMAQKKGLPLKRITQEYLYHKVHPVQYSKDNWELAAQYFRTEAGLWGMTKPGQISAATYQQIMRKSTV